jgi:hypothetical protein
VFAHGARVCEDISPLMGPIHGEDCQELVKLSIGHRSVTAVVCSGDMILEVAKPTQLAIKTIPKVQAKTRGAV